MKKYLIILLVLNIAFISCDENDDAQTDPVNPTDGFVHNTVFYETANAYFQIDEEDDDNDNLPDNYTLFFTNGRLFDNDPAAVNGLTDDLLLSINTTSFVFLQIEVSDNPSLTTGPLQAGNTYVVSSNNSVIIENGQVNPIQPPFFTGGFEFGLGDENVGVFNFPGVQGPSITIDAINLDIANPSNSTIDATYIFMNQLGEVITGNYSGTFGVFFD